MSTLKKLCLAFAGGTLVLVGLGSREKVLGQNLDPFDKDSVVRQGLRDSDPFTPGTPANKLVCAIHNGITEFGYNEVTFHGYNEIVSPCEAVVINVHSGLVLDYKDKGPDSMECYLEVAKRGKVNKYQRWILDGDLSKKAGVIKNSNSQRALDYEDKDPVKGRVYLEENKNNKYQQWRFVPVGEGQVLIENIRSGRVLDYKDKGSDRWDVYLEKKKGARGSPLKLS